MRIQVPSSEIKSRLSRFRAEMDASNPEWEMAIFFSKINQYYFTGTIQDGLLIIDRNDDAKYFVRRNYDRAVLESTFPDIIAINSFKDCTPFYANIPDTVYLETEIVPLAQCDRLLKYLPFKHVKSLDRQIAIVRSVKSPYELSFIEQAGSIHKRVIEEQLPHLLKEGMSEADLSAELFRVMMHEGHQGVCRFGAFETEIIVGHIGFGESSLYPNYQNGPGGNVGLCAAVPTLGSRERKLKYGDLVFVDGGCGVEGYHTDKTMTYMFGKPLEQHAITAHEHCVSIEHQIAEMLKPGVTPEHIYKTIIAGQSSEFLENFMGVGKGRVRFLGHGIGLVVDEFPAIAEGFTRPLEEGMAVAIEPKKGIPGIGMVGSENTYIITPQGGRSVTGNHAGLIRVF